MTERRPTDAPLSAADANRRLYASIAETYDRSEECVVDERLRGLLREAPARGVAVAKEATGSPRVLDAGGGSGNASMMLFELGVQPVTVDISPQMLQVFRSKAQARGHLPDCVIAELREFMREDGRSWDLIVFSGVLHHLEELEEILRLTRMRMRPGGVIVTMFDPTRTHALGRLLRRADYLLHVMVRTPRRLLSLAGRRVPGGRSVGAEERSVGEMAERHAVTGLDDLDIRAEFVEAGWEILEHGRRFEGRFGVTRAIFQALRQHSSFSLIVRAPLEHGVVDEPSSR